MVQQIVIEAETPGDSRTMFRLRIDASVIAEELTAVQAHILFGEILERVALPKASERAPSVTESDASTPSSASFPSPGQSRVRAMIDGLFWRVPARDQVEAMLAAQMAAVHMAAMTFARRLANVETIPQQDSAERAFNKLAQTFAAQVEALKRYRSGGEQKMTVQHVHVAEGGQAIVGNISAPAGVGAKENSGGQPHAALAYALAQLAQLWSGFRDFAQGGLSRIK
jgi:hypothetical protein